MIVRKQRSKQRNFWFSRRSMAMAMLVSSIFCYFPLRRAIAYLQAPEPQGILVLGGDRSREYHAARLTHAYPNLDVWISSGSLPVESAMIFEKMGADLDSVELDYNATDTVSNFTTILPQLKAQEIKHVYLVTSDYHMNRAGAIATIILGSQGITYTPVVVPSPKSNESLGHIIRDVARSMFWLASGKTGSSLKHQDCHGVSEIQVVVDFFKLKNTNCQQITQR